jgi:hypothetical protein
MIPHILEQLHQDLAHFRAPDFVEALLPKVSRSPAIIKGLIDSRF